MFPYTPTHSSIPCVHAEQILFHTTAIQVFEDGYIHTSESSLLLAVFHESWI